MLLSCGKVLVVGGKGASAEVYDDPTAESRSSRDNWRIA
jgi:hypothetical protein